MFIEGIAPGASGDLRRQLATVAGSVARVRRANMFEKAAEADRALLEVLALLVGLVDRVETLEALANAGQ